MAKTESRRFEILELTPEARQALLDRMLPGYTLSEEDSRLLRGVLTGFPELVGLVEQKGMTVGRLLRILFGSKTERTAKVLGDAPREGASMPPGTPPAPKPKRKGHGRHGVGAYTGARRVRVAHPKLHAGDPCPECSEGKLHPLSQPSVVLRLVGQAPVEATAYELERLRCSTCGKVFTAPPPPEAGTGKYDESVGVMLGILRFGAGEPFHRLARLQRDLGVPLAESTQWELTDQLARTVTPVVECLIREGAQRRIVFNDDTGMRVASLRREPAPLAAESDPKKPRTGIFTTGIVTGGDEPPIALFFTGHRHAGENLHDVLSHRAKDLPPPIQMCDGLSRNVPKEFQTLLSSCLAHCRRQFVDVAESFPAEVRRVLESLRQVYRNDAEARERKLSPAARLLLHQESSRPVMDELHRSLREQMDRKEVEPNSGLGGAINYLLKRWEPLTVFLREPGAPLDNNICERSLKMAILHRKNSLSYKTERGAEVGDTLMSLIHTCRLNAINSFEYLVALARNARQVAESPASWLPWNYRSAMAANSG